MELSLRESSLVLYSTIMMFKSDLGVEFNVPRTAVDKSDRYLVVRAG